MEGYLQNNGDKFYFTIQRNIAPGGKIPLDDVYLSLGKKSGLEEGPEFIKWLLDIFLAGKEHWAIYDKDGAPLTTEGSGKKKKAVKKETASLEKTSSPRDGDARGAGRVLRRAANNEKTRGVEVTPSLIIESDFLQAKELIDSIKDKPVLKRALHLSRHFSNKEKHMRHLMKRLEQV